MTPFLTIFSAPKPFRDAHISTIQRNAIACWKSLGDVRVILLGDEEGMAQAAAEFDVMHLPQVACNSGGTPLVSSMFSLACAHSDGSPLMMCTNADMLYRPDLVEVVRRAASQAQSFLMVGQRWDLDVTERLNFTPGWGERLLADVQRRASLHLPAGSDYFIYPRHLFTEMPDFTIGRSGWDNWMIYHARREGWAVVDATPDLMAVHQNHDYRHLPGGKPHYDHPESHDNVAKAGGAANLYTILDADRQMRNGRLQAPRWSALRFLRAAEMWFAPGENAAGRKSKFITLRRWTARRFRRLRRRLTGSL